MLVSKDVGDARLLYLDAGCRQAKRKQTAIAHDAKVGGRGNSHAVVVVGRVLDGIRIEAPCPELKHSSHVEGDRLCRPCDWIFGFWRDDHFCGGRSAWLGKRSDVNRCEPRLSRAALPISARRMCVREEQDKGSIISDHR